MKILEVRDLCKKYPGFSLDKVSFSLESGEITGFIGRNGAGKTTTLKSILNLVHPDAGEIRFFGMDFSENELEIKRRIGFVSGGAEFYPMKKLSRISEVTRRFYEQWDEAAYTSYMQKFNLDPRKTPAQLSAGMKVKYALTLALSHGADLLILDEPTSGLDPVSRDELLDIFLELARHGKTILFSTHITSDLDKCADRLVYIQSGRILIDEPLDDLLHTYQTAAVTEEEKASIPPEKLIGCKPARRGYTALVNAEDAGALGVTCTPANLEDIMVHLDREEAQA